MFQQNLIKLWLLCDPDTVVSAEAIQQASLFVSESSTNHLVTLPALSSNVKSSSPPRVLRVSPISGIRTSSPQAGGRTQNR